MKKKSKWSIIVNKRGVASRNGSRSFYKRSAAPFSAKQDNKIFRILRLQPKNWQLRNTSGVQFLKHKSNNKQQKSNMVVDWWWSENLTRTRWQRKKTSRTAAAMLRTKG